MSFDNIIDEIADEYVAKSTFATREEVVKVLKDGEAIINKFNGATPIEIVNRIIDDCVDRLSEILRDTPTPGIVSSLQVGNIHINLFGGKLRTDGARLNSSALFDVASITKLYTQIIAYKLINEGAFKLSDKIGELDPRFENVGDLTVSDVLTFVTSFRTNGRIEDVSTRSEAEEKLFGMEVVQKGTEYDYNDMGLMMMKEVMENVTGKPYTELFEEYITTPYGLTNTYLVVPENKLRLVTGTPNLDGSVNDLKANAMGGFSGHAGVRVSSEDLIKLSQGINRDYVLRDGLYLPNYFKPIRSAKIGSSYINPKTTINKNGEIVSAEELSYFGKLAPTESLAAQGSTRVITRASSFNGIDINSTALSNIAGITDEEMKKAIEIENQKRLERNPNSKLLDPKVLMKERTYDGHTYNMHDPRALMNEDATIGHYLYRYDNEVNLKLLLLQLVLSRYEHYYDDIVVNRKIG